MAVIDQPQTAAPAGFPSSNGNGGHFINAGEGGVPQDRIAADLWFLSADQQGKADAADFAADLSAAMDDDEQTFAQTD